MVSIIGATATWRFSEIRVRSGSSQPTLHSQWESINVTVGACSMRQKYGIKNIRWFRNAMPITVAWATPRIRPFSNPIRVDDRTIFTLTGILLTYTSSGCFRWLRSLWSSNKMISLSKARGDLVYMLHSVRISVDQASFRNTIITDVCGNLTGYGTNVHLSNNNYESKIVLISMKYQIGRICLIITIQFCQPYED